MAGTTTSNIPALIVEDYEPGIRETFYEYTAIMKAFPPSQATSGNKETWKFRPVGTDNSQATTEGAPAPSPNVTGAQNLEISKQAFDVVAMLTHEGIDYTNVGGDPWANELSSATKRLMSKVNTTLMSSFEAAIAAGSTYGGKTRTDYSQALVSYAETSSDSLTLQYIETMVRTLTDADRGNDMSDLALYMSPTLMWKYGKLANQSTGIARSTNREVGGKSDGGVVYTVTGDTPSFEGIPIIPMIGMTATTVVCGPGLSADEVKVAETAGPRLWDIGKVARDHRALIDCDYVLRVKQPALWGTLTNKS